MEKSQQLVFKLLEFLKKKEFNSYASKYYYVQTEFDSNVTDFEALSNANLLILCSSLHTKYVIILMWIFQAVWDDNYCYFEDG